MNDINRVWLIGRVTSAAELKFHSPELAICTFSIAVNRSVKRQGEWEDAASFFDVTVFGRRAETVSKYLLKGKQVAVDGELRQDRWDKDGERRSKVHVVANGVQLLRDPGQHPAVVTEATRAPWRIAPERP
jgi:single-strand DNA-binding protein